MKVRCKGLHDLYDSHCYQSIEHISKGKMSIRGKPNLLLLNEDTKVHYNFFKRDTVRDIYLLQNKTRCV